MTKCPKGLHPDYDENQYKAGCPKCPKLDEGDLRKFSTPLTPKAAPPPLSTPATSSTRRPTIYKWAGGVSGSGSSAGGAAEGLSAPTKGHDPVVGWLVAVDGPLKGADFRIYHGNNSLGRGLSNRICVDDPEISAKSHSNILYAQFTNTYHISPSPPDVKGLVYLRPPGDNQDWELVQNVRELPAFWVIKIGGTDFIFVPFCNGDFLWSV